MLWAADSPSIVLPWLREILREEAQSLAQEGAGQPT
jgi:hypothetical protein